MTETVKLDAATLDEFAAEFNQHYEAKAYAEAYPYGIVLFDQGRREKSFLHHLASVSVFTNKRTPLLKRLRSWAEQPEADAIAHELIAGLVHHLGDEQENREHALKYAQKNALDHKLEYEPEHVRLRVVVLKTVASGVYNFNASKHSFNIPEGHNNLNGMLAPFINQYSVLVDDLGAAKAAIESLEHVDVIYNAITDPDRCADALNNAAALCDSFADIPVVNHPRAILETTRDNNYQRFHKNRHIIYPKNVKLPLVAEDCHAQITQAIVDNELNYPVIVRLAGYQNGKNTHLIDSAHEQDFKDFDAVVTKNPKDIFLIEYIDVSFKDKRAPRVKLFPKFRAFFAGGKLYPIHMPVAANNYMVHVKTAEDTVKANPWLVEREKIYCRTPEKVVPVKLWKALEKTMSDADLEYIGVDFALGKDAEGNEGIVIFEMNAAMGNRMHDLSMGKHVRLAWQKTARRMHHVFCDKAGIPAWNFYLPIDSQS